MAATPQDLQVGEAVYYRRENQVGIIYEIYKFVAGPSARPGVSLLLSDGRDMGGWSAEEADQFLEPLGNTGLDYEYKNVGQLHSDYGRGVFADAFHVATVLAGGRDKQ